MVPVETREKVYPSREYWQTRGGTGDRGGVGHEIVRELPACLACLKKQASESNGASRAFNNLIEMGDHFAEMPGLSD